MKSALRVEGQAKRTRGRPRPEPYRGVALWVESVLMAQVAVNSGGAQALDYAQMALTKDSYGASLGADDSPLWRAMDALRTAQRLLHRAAWRRGRKGQRDVGLWWQVASGQAGLREVARRAEIEGSAAHEIVSEVWPLVEEILWEAGVLR